MSGADVTVLVIEDDPAIRRFLRNTLSVQNFNVLEAVDGTEARGALRRERPDLVILDLGLPDIDGMTLLRETRGTSTVPILVLSSRDDEKSKVTALNFGADDYVTKPFGVDELMARMRTALRHGLAVKGSPPKFRSGGLEVDLVLRRICVDGLEVKLSRKEYDILRQLVIHAGKVLTHQFLIREVWAGATDKDVQYLRVYIRQIRQKLEKHPERPMYIITEAGVGYRLQVLDED